MTDRHEDRTPEDRIGTTPEGFIAAEVDRLAAGAVRDMRMLDQLAEHGTVGDWHESATDDAAVIEAWLEHHGIEEQPELDWWEVLDVVALEVRTFGELIATTWEPSSFTVVTGTGGPHVEATFDYDGSRLVGAAYWGREKAERHGPDVPNLAGMLDEVNR